MKKYWLLLEKAYEKSRGKTTCFAPRKNAREFSGSTLIVAPPSNDTALTLSLLIDLNHGA
jgi:hypothetical protein